MTSKERDAVGVIDGVETMKDIVWRVWENSWFEYPDGSSLFFHWFPIKYSRIARDGVPIFIEGELPSTIRAQPPATPEATEVLRDKLQKMLLCRYIEEPGGPLQALIFYFGVPKG